MRVIGDNILLEKLEQKDDSGFIQTDQSNTKTPQYKVAHAGGDAGVYPRQTVILKPGNYYAIQVDGVVLTCAEGEDVLVVL